MRQHVIALVERHLGRFRRFSGESNITMRCPFHKGGQETKPSFSVNVDTGVFHCFTCKASGAIPKMLSMLGLSKEEVDREVADIRQDLEDNRRRLHWHRRSKWVGKDPMQAQTILPETLLRPFEWCPLKLVEYGFRSEILRDLEVGYDRNLNRIMYPIRDVYGHLAGMVGGASIAGQWPKYKVYTGRTKDPLTGQWRTSDYGEWFDENYPEYEFRNHNHIWNYDRVYPRLFFGKEADQTLIIVEGYKALIWLIQNGYWNTVALMGSSMSDEQYQLLRRLRVNFVLFLDDDDAGIRGTEKIGRRMYKEQPGIHVAQYPQDAAMDQADGGPSGLQPDDLAPGEIASAICRAKHFPKWQQERRHEHHGRSAPWSGTAQ